MSDIKENGKGTLFSTWQQTSLVTSTLIGVGVLTLPRTATALLKEAGWMATLLGSALVMFAMVLISWLSKCFPGLTFVEYTSLVWGTPKKPWLGKLLGFPWVFAMLIFFYLATALTARVFGEVVVTAVLLETPLEVLIISMFFLALFLCLHEVEVVARVNELLFPLILFPILFIALASFQKAEWNNVLPLFSSSWTNLVISGTNTALAFQGYEIMLIFFAFAKLGTDKMRAGLIGVGFAAVVYTLIVLAGIVVFGYEEMQRQTWPTLELVKNTKIPGLILERLESAFLGVWVAAVFTSTGNYYYAFIYGLRQYFGRGMLFQRTAAFIFLIPLFYISLVPKNIEAVNQAGTTLGRIGLVITIGVPLVYVLVTLLRGLGKKRNKGESE